MTDKLERGYASVENEEYRKGYRDGWRDAMKEERLDKIEPLRPMQPEKPLTPMKPSPYEPGIPWVKPMSPGLPSWPWPDDMMPSYYRCPMCGLLKTNMTKDCTRQNCPQHYTGSWHTKTTDNTSGK